VRVKRLGIGDEMLAHQTVIRLKKETPAVIKEKIDPRYIRDFLRRDRNYLLVALVEDEPIGFALAYRLMRVDRAQDMMLFYEIVVDESHRQKGAGMELIRALKQICRDSKIMKMWVSTNRSNTAAMELYRSAGGVERIEGDEVTFTYFPDRYEIP
jgi:ribosomal protein S18 acetylase RimI-like enzyme